MDQAEAALQQARVRLGLPPTGTDERVDPEKTAIVRQARAMLDDARLTRDRSVKLMQQELIARAQLDSAEAAFQVAEAATRTRSRRSATGRRSSSQRRSELELARQQLADTVILSPIDGAVSVKQASVGEYLTAGAPIATLVRVHPLRLRVPVPEREGAGVRVGHAVTLTAGGRPHRLPGPRGAPVADRAGAEPHAARRGRGARTSAGFLRPGAFARVEIVTEVDAARRHRARERRSSCSPASRRCSSSATARRPRCA